MIVNVGTVVNTDVRTMQGERLKMKEEVHPNTFYSHNALPYALPLLVSGCSRRDRTERVYHVPEHWGPKLSRWRVHIPRQQGEDSFIYIYICASLPILSPPQLFSTRRRCYRLQAVATGDCLTLVIAERS